MAIGNTMLACILEATKSEAALAAPIIQQGKAWFAGGVSMIGHLRTKLSVWNYTDGGGEIVAVDMPSNEVAFVNWKLPVAKKDADAGKGPYANWCHNSQYVSLSAQVNLGVLIYDGDYYDLPQNGSDMSTTLLSSPWGYDVGGTATSQGRAQPLPHSCCWQVSPRHRTHHAGTGRHALYDWDKHRRPAARSLLVCTRRMSSPY